jgi:predicted transcriptional regulator
MAFKNSKDEKILDLELRNKIFNLVSKHAGSHLRELERKTKIPYSTLKYHLHFLAKHNLILEKSGDGNTKYYPKDIESEDIEILALLRQKNIRKILLFTLTNPSSTPKDLEDFTRLAPSTINWYIAALVKKDVLKKQSGKKLTYKLAYDKNKIMKILITYRESFLDAFVNKTIEMWDIR